MWLISSGVEIEGGHGEHRGHKAGIDPRAVGNHTFRYHKNAARSMEFPMHSKVTVKKVKR